MTEIRPMWCVFTLKHGHSGSAFFVWNTLRYYKRESIAEFIKGSGYDWNYWKKKFNYRCERVTVTIHTVNP